MNNMKGYWVIGPPGAGKSTAVKLLAKRLKNYQLVNDLHHLQGVFALDALSLNYLSTPAETRSNLPTIVEDFRASFPLFDEERLQDRVELLNSTKASTVNLPTRMLSGGGFDIIQPQLWDLILEDAAKSIESNSFIFEFSRGVDREYLDFHSINADQVYDQSFKTIFAHIADESWIHNSVLVHLSCPHLLCLERNELRRVKGEHFVDETVMKSVYKIDPFKLRNFEGGFAVFGNHRLPILSIDNVSNLEHLAASLKQLDTLHPKAQL
ncbi:MAG: hypothetical protein AB3N28_01900 [Kordiimonas sp.]